MTSANLAREWSKSQRNILAFIGSLVSDFTEAEDLLQETAAQVFEHADRYDPTRPFLPWAFAIARHVVLNHRRRAGRNSVIFDQAAVVRLAKSFEEISTEREEMRGALKFCREKLPPRSRQVCRLRYEGGLLPGVIAERIGLTSGAVRTLLHRIRVQLRRCIEQQLKLEQ